MPVAVNLDINSIRCKIIQVLLTNKKFSGTADEKPYRNQILCCLHRVILIHDLIKHFIKNAIREVGGAESRLGFGKSKLSTFIEGPVIT